MEKVSTLEFEDDIFEEMQKFDIGMSLANAKIDYKSIYGREVSEDYIKAILMKDERFIFVNSNYFLLRETLESIKSEYGNGIEEMEKFIKDKYFIKDVDRKVFIDDNQSIEVCEYDTMVLKFKDKVYEINDEDDFHKAIIEKGVITYDAVKAIARYLEKDYYMLVDELNDIGVNLKADAKCVAYGKTCISETEYMDNGENILLLDLRTNEIVACLTIIYLLRMNFDNVDASCFSDKHLSGLYKLNIINDYKNERNIILTLYGQKIMERVEEFFNEICFTSNIIDEFNICENSKELAKSKVIKEIDCPDLWKMVSEPFKEIYLNNAYSRTLIDLVREANKKEVYSLGDIILYYLEMGKYEKINKIFIGKTATSGNKPIKEGTDICFKCRTFRCSKGMCISKNKLLYYRSHYVNKVIKEIEEDINKLDILMKDPLIIKFIVPYNLTSKNKIIMQNIGLIDSKFDILHKKDGEYCSFKDIWILTEDEND